MTPLVSLVKENLQNHLQRYQSADSQYDSHVEPAKKSNEYGEMLCKHILHTKLNGKGHYITIVG